MTVSRTDYVDRKKKELASWNDQLVLLNQNAHETGVVLRQQYGDNLSTMQKNEEAVKKELERISAATDDSWEHLKGDTDNVWIALKDSVANFSSHF